MKTRATYLTCFTIICLLLTGCYTIRAIKWWEPGLDDVGKFKSVKITASSQPFAFINGTNHSRNQKLKTYLDTFLNRTNTDAFIVIRHDIPQLGRQL